MNAKIFKEYLLITLGTFLIVLGAYFFKFPNNFTFGGVTGVAVVVGNFLPVSATFITNILNFSLLLLGFICLGRSFGIKTVYATILTSLFLFFLEKFYPLSSPLTNEPVLEFLFAIFLPSAGAAVLFNIGASGGGTDILAMILKKYTSFNIGSALFFVDLLITLFACFIFDTKTALFSLCGLLTKSFAIDSVIENINLCKYFNIICDNPEPICNFIIKELHRSATICKSEGAYSHNEKSVIITALKRSQAVQLRNFVKQTEPTAFILISSTSEIIGKGFQS